MHDAARESLTRMVHRFGIAPVIEALADVTHQIGVDLEQMFQGDAGKKLTTDVTATLHRKLSKDLRSLVNGRKG